MVIHYDVWGPFSVTSLKGFRWFVTFIDCYCRVTWVYLLKSKSEVFSCFTLFHRMTRTQFETNIKILRSDNDDEYIGLSGWSWYSLSDDLCWHPITNGIAECKNCHVGKVARSFLITMHLSNIFGEKRFWRLVILSTVCLLVFSTWKLLLYVSPACVWFPLFLRESLVVYCFVHAFHPVGGKLGPKVHKCVFVRYSSTQKGYKCHDPYS
jgi:hypothetical protein